jgi:hypothetical protein
LGKGAPVQAFFVRRKGCYLQSAADTKDIFIDRASKGHLFTKKLQELKHKDKIVFADGYRFEFLVK